jgi:ABC-type uncharacterized transport system permease subunit
MEAMPRWADIVLVPLISVLLAFGLSALLILWIGADPWEALKLMVSGSFGSTYGWGYTLYYATNFVFTGLAFAVAFHARFEAQTETGKALGNVIKRIGRGVGRKKFDYS